jgi:serine/threonine protein kinase
LVGQNVGKYRILDRIGKGGMGTVYRALDETLHRDVAIKVLNAELNDPEVAKRFRAEAITVARLSHPGIATIYELFEHEGQWLMVMEYVRGETLEGLVSRMGPLSAQRTAELCMQALVALAHAHSMGVVHRDLKPANLMITENGSVKVMDFGIARVSGSEHMTNAGFMMGTPAYMAPEQVRGGEVDARTDLYAMGVVFYRLATAKLPFKGDTAFAMVQSQVHEAHTPVGLVRTDLPAWVEEVVTRALAKAPEQRFQSAAEFHEALARCMAGLSIASMYNSETMMTPSRPMPSGTFPMPSGAYPMRSMGTPTAGYSSPSTQETVVAPGTSPGMISAATDPTMVAPSGATQIPAVVKTAAPTPPSPTVTVKKPIPVMLIAGGAVALIAVAVVGYMMTRGRNTGEPPAATPTAEVSPSPTPGGDALATGVTDPATTTANASPTPTAVPGATPTASPKPGAPTPTPGAIGAGKPTTSPVVDAGAPLAGRGTTAAATVDAVADTPVTFPDVKLYEVDGKKVVDKDALLNFGNGQMMIMPRTGGAAIATLPYKRITSGTYIKARGPKWDPALSFPTGVDAGSFSGGLIRTNRHWLVLQGMDHSEIFRLEDNNVERVLEAVETRTKIKIDRPKG